MAAVRGRSLRCPILVGRAGELDELTDAVASTAAGRGRLLAVIGEAGVGKSRLVAATADTARSRGMALVRGRAVAAGAAVPYRPWAEALQAAARDPGLAEDPALTPFRSALVRLVPAWRQAGALDGDESPVTLGEGVLRVLRVLGGARGTVAVLEDLHWADPDSVALLEYLADKLAEEPIVLLVTCRVEEESTALHTFLELRGRRDAELIKLHRLGDAALRAMAGACLGAPEPPEEVHELLRAYADGLPFFVEELLASLVDRGALVREHGTWQVRGVLKPSVPLTFAASFRQRVRSLPAGAERVLAGAAMIGGHFDWRLLSPACGTDDEQVLDVLRQATAVQLIEEDEGSGRFRFRHALSRDAALGMLLSPERAVLARGLLDALTEQHPQLPGEWCEVGAALAREAGEVERAARLLVESARRALVAGALATAITAAGAATDLADGAATTALEASEVLVTALALAGQADRAEEVGSALLVQLSRTGAPPVRRARIHSALARSAAAATRWGQARQHVDAALELLADAGEPALRAELEVLNAQVALGQHRPSEAARAAEVALDMARATDQPAAVCEALEILGRVERLTDWRRAEARFAEALEIAETAHLPLWRIRAMGELGIQDVFAAGSPNRLELARRLAVEAGALVQAAHADLHLAVLHHMHHDLEAEQAAIERAETAARRYRLGLLLPAVLANRALLKLAQGREQAAEEASDEALRLCDGDPQVEAAVRGLPRALLALVRGDRAEARRELEGAVAVMPPASDAASGPFADMLLLLRTLDGDLSTDAWQALAPPGRNRHRLGEGFFHAAEAVRRGREGDEEAAAEAMGRADATLSGTPGFRRLVRFLVAEAAIRDGWGDPVPWLRDAVAFFDSTGWQHLASAGRALLRRAGATAPRQRTAGTPTALAELGITPREAEVLALVEQGLPNRAIAERLVLSVRTVEKHVERLLDKTGTATRAQLAALSARLTAQEG